MAERQDPPSLKSHFIPTSYTPSSCIQLPATTATHYEIDPNMIQMLPSFYGKEQEDPYRHLNEFIEICSLVKIQDFTDDELRLRLLPFSLKDNAKNWWTSLPANSITTWEQMQQVFLKKYFSIGRTKEIRQAITSFKMQEGEQFHETWQRFRELIRKCPHHAVPKWQLVESLYDGLSPGFRQMVNASCGGSFMMTTEDDGWDLFETLSENSTMSQPRGLNELGQFSNLSAKVDELSRKLDSLLSLGHISSYSRQSHLVKEVCQLCSNPGHYARECHMASQFFTQSSRPPSLNTSNPQAYNLALAQQPYQQPLPPSTQRTPSFEEQMLQAMDELRANSQLHHSHSQLIAKLETQVGQIANAFNFMKESKLSSQPMTNQIGVNQIESLQAHEQANIVLNLRNGREVETRPEVVKAKEKVSPHVAEGSKVDKRSKEKETDPVSIVVPGSSETPSYIPKAPFPTCLNAPSPFRKKGAKQEDMIEVVKQVKINLPLLEAISQVSAYAKFLKDLCTQKRKSKTHEPKEVRLTEQVSSILTRNTPIKRKDFGVPIISCVIGDHVIDRALLDLGASVNLLPYSVYEQLGLRELKPTLVTLQLADRSIKVPRGVIEDVLVKVDKFYFPVDFIVLDMEAVHNPNKQIPLILGRPFLATANASIHCRTGVMDISFGNMRVQLNVFDANLYPCKEKDCFAVSESDYMVDKAPSDIRVKGPIEMPLMHVGLDSGNIEMGHGSLNSKNHIDEPPWSYTYIEPWPIFHSPSTSPLIEVAPRLEWKSPPYACLGPGNIFSGD
ncbi:uncharacterized protein LOC131313877 [Rhododendron vialii]|uniref:uncharacterized protein LOC131313877 n=1 Tax=Rhododendron vialii TaxID=182163 RepID=UPI00265ED77E|nr:uncharacterized protein LOC131313877 [Rhododendron vialii]